MYGLQATASRTRSETSISHVQVRTKNVIFILWNSHLTPASGTYNHFSEAINHSAHTPHPKPRRCSEVSGNAADHGNCLKENRDVDNSEQTPNFETSEKNTGDQHDDTVLTSVARVVGSALGTVASTASKVLAPSTAEPAKAAETNQAEAAAQKRPAPDQAPESKTATARTKAAEASSRPRVKASARTTSQTSGRRTAKKKAKAKAHRRKIKHSNTNG
jgi:hypothetical protein